MPGVAQRAPQTREDWSRRALVQRIYRENGKIKFAGERPFIEAAQAVGAGKFYIIRKHVLPNVFSFVYVTLATFVPGAIITEASLSWLGLFDPTVVSWGRMLQEFTNSGIILRGISEYWFWVLPPGILIAVLALSFILLGFALDEILNPRLRRRQ